jgi:hypothetical protein
MQKNWSCTWEIEYYIWGIFENFLLIYLGFFLLFSWFFFFYNVWSKKFYKSNVCLCLLLAISIETIFLRFKNSRKMIQTYFCFASCSFIWLSRARLVVVNHFQWNLLFNMLKPQIYFNEFYYFVFAICNVLLLIASFFYLLQKWV